MIHPIKAAGAEIDVAASQYLPTMDLVASYGRAKSENLSSLSQRSNTFAVGFQVSIPLFAGGYNRANVARSRSERTRLQQEFRAAIERTQAEVVRQYTNIRTGADLIQALQAAEAAGELSLASATKGFSVGVFSNLDVLKVQERLYRTRLDLAKAKLDYVLARLKLVVAAGRQEADTFREISDVYLGPVVRVAGGMSRQVLHDAAHVD